MSEILAQMSWEVFAALLLLGLLLCALMYLAHQDGYMAGQRHAERRNRQQQKYDYDRGVVEGVRSTVAHLRATGQLVEFRQPPTQVLTDRQLR